MSSISPDKTLRIAVISGGDSAEAEISRISGNGVLHALSQNYPLAVSFELDNHLTKALAVFNPDVVFPVLHGPPGEDGTFQGFLEILGYSYVGSDVRSSAIAMDKIVSKRIFASHGLPLAQDIELNREDGIPHAIAQITDMLGSQVVIKPARQGSSLGVTLISEIKQLREALETAFQFDEQLLVEQRIRGKEMTVGVIDTDEGSQAFPIIEITTPGNSWYDYEHRYTKGLSEHLIPADLTAAQSSRLLAIAIRAHQVLGCRDLSRADFIITGNDMEYLLEVNTMPGMTPTSLYPDGAQAFGLGFEELMSHLVERAARRR